MKTILVLVDFTRGSEHAAECALRIACEQNAEVLLYNVFYVPAPVPETIGPSLYYEDYKVIENDSLVKITRLAERIKARYKKKIGSEPPVIHLKNASGSLNDALQHLLARQRFWLVMMGDISASGVLWRFISGSDSRSVIDKTKCPVLIVSGKSKFQAVRKIAFASTLEAGEKQILPFLTAFAEPWNAEIEFIHIIKAAESSAGAKARNYDIYQRIVKDFDYPFFSYRDQTAETTVDGIREYARRARPELIALIHHKRNFFRQFIDPGISKNLTHFHEYSLLVFPGK